MPEIYADWKSLKPLTEPVPVGTKCVVIDRLEEDEFKVGEVVTIKSEESKLAALCINTDGVSGVMAFQELAILPADYQAEPKAEQKPERKEKRHIVAMTSFQVDGQYVIHAACNDGSMWTKYPGYSTWERSRIPPIPQD